METRHPWQSGPTELISYALRHLHRPGDFYQRIAYLLLDVGVETLLRTYLELPAEVTRTRMPPEESRQAAAGDLHELVERVKSAAGSRLHRIDLSDVESYHQFRNELYQQGSGIPVPAEQARGYAELAVKLLRRLLDIDLESQLVRLRRELERRQHEAAMLHQIQRVQSEIGLVAAAIDRGVRLAVEAIEPEFLMPSFERELEQWLKQLEQGHLSRGLQQFDPQGSVRQPDPSVARAISMSMPSALRHFVATHELEPVFLAFQLQRAHSDTERFLVFADSTLGLSASRNTAGLYWLAKLLAEEDPLGGRPAQERDDHQLEQSLAAFRERCIEALADLQGIGVALHDRLKKLTV
jgi:hypothetical protein